MKRLLAVVAAMLGLFVSAGYAAAEPPGDATAQVAGQTAGSGQTAGALSGASQTQPTNRNISVRVLSPGDSGDVSQSNTVNSNATAGNANVTKQSADQTQNSSCGCAGGTQAIGQESKNEQAATALSLATQLGASNTNVPVRVLSPGDDGSVRQSNSVDSGATAANLNATEQDADQDQAGGGTQAIGQASTSDQDAGAASAAEQQGAANTNISVRVLSPGDDGYVSQSNSVDSSATALNLNGTRQDADQDQGGKGSDSCCSSGGTQAIGQESRNSQTAGAFSVAAQQGASNTNIPVRVLSPGDGGSVRQSNSVDSTATAANLNLTAQDADQDQGGSGGAQAIGQESKSDQTAVALSGALQSGASNTNTPVRVGSRGDDGHVSQSNSVDSDAKALNANLTKQDADQDQSGGGCCSSGGTQAIGQSAKNDQTAAAASLAVQTGGDDRCGCASGGNVNTPVRVDSKGDAGNVRQSNTVDSDATAANLNLTSQDADQYSGGGHDKKDDCCSSGGTQAIGQESKNEQQALAFSAALQSGASNSNTPVRVDSEGDGGHVSQSNSVDSDAAALNLNETRQDADQDQGGKGDSHCCSSDGIQAIGQESKNEQTAVGLSAALQFGASNADSPVRVDSKGDDGSVSQSNSVDSDATAVNANGTKQDADQDQSGGSGKECGCHDSIGIQAIGQESKSEQDALAGSLAVQAGGDGKCGCSSAGNANEPVRVDSKGDGGRVWQSNSVDSDATALNLNATEQDADQDQAGGSGIAIQAIGQSADNEQEAVGLSGAFQFGASNSNTPVAVDSRGDDGSARQSNSVDSDATALNLNATEQDADQDQRGGRDCGCHDSTGIQAIGQKSENEQAALAGSLAFQGGGHGKCGCDSGGNSNAPVHHGSRSEHGTPSMGRRHVHR